MAMDIPRPFQREKNIPVVFCADGRFLPYAAVALASLVQMAREGLAYDVFIVSGENWPEADKNRLRAVTGGKSNISLRFICAETAAELLPPKAHIRENYTLSTYYRLLLPKLFEHYDKIIYADTDVLFLHTPHKLYELPLPAHCVLAAAPDVQPYAGDEAARARFAAYSRRLGLAFASQYVNAGVLVWDLRSLRAQKLDEKIRQALYAFDKPLFMDQDILNAALAGKIYPLPLAYNFFAQEPDLRPPLDAEAEKYRQARREAAQDPAIIHYAGFAKPWLYPHMPYAAPWWQAAAQTPFYDEILARLHTHDRRMRRRRRLRGLLWAELYFYKALNKLPAVNLQDKILRLSDRLDMDKYWAENRFKKNQEER